MTDKDDVAETYERWYGPVQTVIRRGGRKVPLSPPVPGTDEPFMWTIEPDEVVAMDVDGRPVEGVLVLARAGRGEILVTFKDGEKVTYDQGPISTSSCHE